MDASLQIHPACPNSAVDKIEVSVERPSATLLRFRYVVLGRIDDLVLPPAAPRMRADDLWRTTCFEAFLKPEAWPGYCELNFSPSSQWAAFDFSDYRDGMMNAGLPAVPDLEMVSAADRFELIVGLSLDLPRGPYLLGLSAVMEEKDRTKSYWALAHPPGAPDFHHPDCFVLELPPAI